MKIQCEVCPHTWTIKPADSSPHLCHMCGWDQYLHAFNSKGMADFWRARMLGESVTPKHSAKESINVMTFGDLNKMLYRGLVGDLGTTPIKPSEELKGEHFNFTLKGDVVVYAKDNTESAVKFDQLYPSDKELSHEEKATKFSIEEIERAVAALSDQIKEDIFQNGKRMVHVEIITPSSKNVIPYNKNVMLFHGGKTDTNKDLTIAAPIVKEIVFANTDPQGYAGSMAFDDAATIKYLKLYKTLRESLYRLRDEFSLTDNNTVKEYKVKWWEKEIQNIEEREDMSFSSSDRKKIIDNWAAEVPVDQIEDDYMPWLEEYSQNELVELQLKINLQFDTILLKANMAAIERVINMMIANAPKNMEILKGELKTFMAAIKDSQNKIQTLQEQLERLEISGLNQMVPAEGLIFIDRGRPKKVTSAFIPTFQVKNTLPTDTVDSAPEGNTKDELLRAPLTNKDKLKKVLKLKVINPQTGNPIKIDTAMDYNRNHPVHKIALRTVRQHMQGISDRAGIPKNKD